MDSSRGVPDGTDSNEPSSTGTQTLQEQSPTLTWKPNETLLSNLVQMGISSVVAKKALYYTKNVSTEAAIDWIFENTNTDLLTPLELELQNDPQSFEALGGSSIGGHSANLIGTSASNNVDDDDDELYKMVFIVNAELSMGVGKIAAQVAHAALGLHRILLQHQEKYGESLLNWAEYGETKIVLRGETTEHLINLEHKAIDLNLPCYLVHDAGKTQVKSGSTTVLSIFGSNKRVDKVTGLLKLY